MKKIPGVLVAGALLSNCGGGGGGGAAVPAPVSGSPVLAQTKAQISIKIPNSVASQLRYGKYIPANAASVRISVTAVNGVPPNPAIPDIVQALNPNAAGCSNATGSLVCTINAIVPVANVTLAVSLYQSSDGSGSPLATSTVTVNVVSGVTPNVALTLGGVPSSVTLGGPIVTAADGTTKTVQLPVTVKDASGATIIAPGTYSSPVTFAITGDTNGALSAPPLTGPAQTGQTTEPITYNSAKALTSATITASIAGGTPASTQFNPLVYTPTTLTSMVINGVTASVVVSEAGYAGPFVISGSSPNATICVPANCTPITAGGSVTINVTPASVANLATLTVTDSNNNAANIPLGVASSSAGPVIPGNPTFTLDPVTAGYSQVQFPVAGSDGNIWYSERNSNGFGVGVMSPSTGLVVANYGFVTTAVTNGAALGPDRNVWFADGANNQIAVVSSSTITIYSTNNNVSIPDVLAIGPDNQMWIYGTTTTGSGRAIMEMAPTGATSLMALTGAPIGAITSMLTGPDGNLWFTQSSPAGVGKITPGGFVTDYAGLTGTPNAGLVLGTDGCIWLTENTPNAVAKIRPGTGAITEYGTGISGGATSLSGIAAGGDGNIWFAEAGSNNVDRITTGGLIANYPSGTTGIQSLLLAPNGQLWFTEGASLGWLTY